LEREGEEKLCREESVEEKVMPLEEYFDFQGPKDIRVKGTRVGIETVLYDYVYRSCTPEDIAARYPSLTLEQVYATITYYLHNQETVTGYLADWLETAQHRREEQSRLSSPTIERLRRLFAERESGASRI
jgi:uncharacterized protein (DUF433 family)